MTKPAGILSRNRIANIMMMPIYTDDWAIHPLFLLSEQIFQEINKCCETISTAKPKDTAKIKGW